MITLHEIDVVDDISAVAFLKKYKKKSQPLVIKNLTQKWPATKKWSLEYFESLIGDKEVKLYNSKPSTENELQHAAQTTMPLREYFNLLRQGEKDLRMFFFDIMKEASILKKDFKFPEIGLKFFKRLPVMFLGGTNAKVQNHFDIDYADIILCHFGGKKTVFLFSPLQSQNLYHVPYSFSSLFNVDLENPDYEKYPRLHSLEGHKVELTHGDTLYIPPGWWHYVMYDEISYSMAMRAFPRDIKNGLKLLKNVLIIRSVDGLMRKIMGQKWNDRNERLALESRNKEISN